jgi:hypothetical protein
MSLAILSALLSSCISSIERSPALFDFIIPGYILRPLQVLHVSDRKTDI